VPLRWTVELLDAHQGHTLATATRRINYHRRLSAA
jgi:hypothetical protein